MKSILALLSAGVLCAHGAAQAQASAASQAGSQQASAGKLPTAPLKPGNGQTAALINSDGSSCPRGPNGEEACTVEINGPGAGGGGPAPNLPSDNFGNPVPVGPKILPPREDVTDEQKLAKWKKCGDDLAIAQNETNTKFATTMEKCARDNPDSSGSVGIGGTVLGTGGSMTLPADWFTNPAAKRDKCQADAKDSRDSETRYNQAVADSCKAKALRGG